MSQLTLLNDPQQSKHDFGYGDRPKGVIIHPFGKMHDGSSLVRHVIAYNAHNIPAKITAVGTQPMSQIVESHHIRLFKQCFRLNYIYELAEPITAMTSSISVCDPFGNIVEQRSSTFVLDEEGENEGQFNLWPTTDEMSEVGQNTLDAHPSAMFIIFLGINVVRTKAGTIAKADPFYQENAINWALGRAYEKE